MSNLRTNYKDDVFTGSRKYHTINNPDGTVSFTDETEYEQNGDTYGAAQINEVNGIINNLDASAYRSTDSVENALADNDYLPFYDTSALASKKTAWSNIKSLLTQLLAIKVHNSNSAGTYGAGNASYFGHVKLSDNYTSSSGNASQSVGASSQAAYNAYNTANTNSVNRYNDVVGELTANNRRIYMDYKNGKYGYNTSPNRGSDTFHPFDNVSEFAGGCAIENRAYCTCKCYPGTYEYRAGGKGFGVYPVGVQIWVDDVLVVDDIITTGDNTIRFGGTFTVTKEGTLKTWGEGGDNTDMYFVWGGVWKLPSN